MASIWKMGFGVVLILVGILRSTRGVEGGRVFSFQMHHRFASDAFKNWSTLPVNGSFEYYAVMSHRDHILRRGLFDSPLSFSDGNSTLRIDSLGFLHYTTVELGTPGVKFMVALDTGSDLFWVPCDFTRCAPKPTAFASSDFELSIYSPKRSSTSRKVACNNDLCAHRNHCLGTFSSCPYMVSYVSAETSTSGILVEDVLHLTTESSEKENVEAYVTFGCGQVQSGSFLDIAAPNGLFGLGMEKISVPSILSKEGLIADSFSMCFGHDGVGRIRFGDKGSQDQEETPFNLNPSHPTYNITVTRVQVGTAFIDVEFTALFDSGTSFTYLVEPAFGEITENFQLQARNRLRQPDSRIPFEYCYDMGPDGNEGLMPTLTLTMKGGSQFSIHDPIIVISTQSEPVYCLAIVKSSELNIIGQNFMTGYRVVFNREEFVLGWKKFDCYETDGNTTSTVQPHASHLPPAVAAGLGNYSHHHSAKEAGNQSQSSVESPHYYLIHSSFRYRLLSFFVVCVLLFPHV